MLMSLLKGIGENITIGKKHSMKNSLTCSPLKVKYDPNIVTYISIIMAIPICMIFLCLFI